MKTKIRAGDGPGKNITNIQFSSSLQVLYDVFLYLVLPVGLELSYVKFIKRSYGAFQLCDLELITTLLCYLLSNLLLSMLVKKGFITATLKKLTLTFLVFLQLQEAFFEEIVFDTSIAAAMNSGLIMLIFFKLGAFLLGFFTIILLLSDRFVSVGTRYKELILRGLPGVDRKPVLFIQMCSHYCMSTLHWRRHTRMRMIRVVG